MTYWLSGCLSASIVYDGLVCHSENREMAIYLRYLFTSSLTHPCTHRDRTWKGKQSNPFDNDDRPTSWSSLGLSRVFSSFIYFEKYSLGTRSVEFLLLLAVQMKRQRATKVEREEARKERTKEPGRRNPPIYSLQLMRWWFHSHCLWAVCRLDSRSFAEPRCGDCCFHINSANGRLALKGGRRQAFRKRNVKKDR